MLNPSDDLETQAQAAFELRNMIKVKAREMMSDIQTAQQLSIDKPLPGWEEFIQSKMVRKGKTRDEAILDILISASKTNENVNKMFGLEG